MKYKIVNIKENPELSAEVISLGDSQKQTLGFLPEQAFIDYADRGLILLAVTEDKTLLGYTLFAQNQNHICRLAHVCVHPKWHKHGIGNALVTHIKKITSQMHRIIVKCRRDYGIDHFWESNGFIAKGEKAGRGQCNTTLTLWEYRHQLSLLSLPPEGHKPLAVLDLNVVIDANSNKNNECSLLTSFTYSDEIDYRISVYSYTEVNRSTNKTNRQLTRGQLNSLRHLERCPDPHIVQAILNIIGKSKIDDAEQIASAVHHNADYFITRDTGLTGHYKKIQIEFGLNIYTPTEFIINYCNGTGRDLYFPGYIKSSEISFRPIVKFHIAELFQDYKAPAEKKTLF